MKLILTHEVTGLGEPGDIVEVKDGYGRNFLLPRKLATGWTKGAQKQIDSIKAGRAARAVHDLDEAQAIRGRLSELTVDVPAHAGDTGHLFGSLSASDIAVAVTAAGGPALDKRRIEIGSPIRTLVRTASPCACTRRSSRPSTWTSSPPDGQHRLTRTGEDRAAGEPAALFLVRRSSGAPIVRTR